MTESRDLKGKELAWIQSSRGTLSSVVQPLGWWFEILPARLSWMRAATGSVVPNPNLNIIGYSQRGCVENWERILPKVARSVRRTLKTGSLKQFSATFNLGADEKETNTYVHSTCHKSITCFMTFLSRSIIFLSDWWDQPYFVHVTCNGVMKSEGHLFLMNLPSPGHKLAP